MPALPSRPPTRPWWLAPERTPDQRIDTPAITIHSVQSRAAYDVLARGGVLRPDPCSSDDPALTAAYDWMRRRAADLLPTSGDWLLWGWARTTRRDLVRAASRARGDVLLTARVPREHALLSHVDDWHAVVNANPAMGWIDGESDAAYAQRVQAAYDDLESRLEAAGLSILDPISDWPTEVRRDVEATWECIFDVHAYPSHHHLQAVVHELRPHQVVRAVRIA